jgi:prolyl-tRNA synthetase
MRGREFTMKDAYSFHADETSVQAMYEDMKQAYSNTFRRCGLDFKMVEADSGTIGGSFSHEFMVLADSGEDAVAFCDSCDYASNVEKAAARVPKKTASLETVEDLKEVSTPGTKSVEAVAKFLKVSPQQIVKTIIMENEDGLVAALVRGDRQLNAIKLKNLIGCEWLHSADESLIFSKTKIPCGYIGPVKLDMKVYVDHEVAGMHNFVTGANSKDAHYTGVQFSRDIKAAQVGDLHEVQEGDPCPKCNGGKYQVKRGIEVGHIFILGTKYSSAMKANFLDEHGKENPMIMGCYGIGVGRTAAAAIEQNHDDKGIIWPVPLAPFQVVVIPVKFEEDSQRTACEETYKILGDMGIETLLDDRPERLGVKFKDAELLGIPLQIIIGPKNLENGQMEIKSRKTGTSELIDFPAGLQDIPNRLKTT